MQATTHLAISPNSNHILSGSPDASILLWSLPTLLSFEYTSPYSNAPTQFSPLKTLSSHRDAVTALIFGHSHSKINIAISASTDKTLIVWDPLHGEVLHTFLLSSPTISLALDPADRACYAGYDDGSIQFIDFYKSTGVAQMIRDPALQDTPTQPSYDERWRSPTKGEEQATLCLQVSYDGTMLLSGHKNGKIHAWDIGRGLYSSSLAEYEHPVTNIVMLPPTGFPKPKVRHVKLKQVVKPRYESSFAGEGADAGKASGVPLNYTFTTQFTSKLPMSTRHEAAERDFHDALLHPSFPDEWLEEGIAELEAYSSSRQNSNNSENEQNSDDLESSNSNEVKKLKAENDMLKAQVAEAVARHRETINQNTLLEKQRWRQREEERIKGERKKRRRLRRIAAAERARKKFMGEPVEGDSDEEMDDGGEGGEEEALSSDTDEITESE